MINRLKGWWSRRERELNEARRENKAARQAVEEKLRKAREEGSTAQLSRAALERITAHDLSN